MYGWKEKTSGPFNVTIKSGWPYYHEFSMSFDISLTYDGKVKLDDSGSLYIFKAQIIPTSYQNTWTTSTFIKVQVSNPYNIGTQNKAIACLEITLDIKVESSIFDTKYWVCHFYVTGDGKITKGSCSKIKSLKL
jgi:hypothetical protein